MPAAAPILGVILALASAAFLGGGDYAGGRAAHRANQYQALALAGFSGLVILAAAALLWRESFPGGAGVFWSMLSGLGGALGLACLYQALALGSAASVAPVSAVVGAGIPVLFAAFTEGLPGPDRLIGFALALAGIWLVAYSPAGAPRPAQARKALLLAFAAGVGFGAFYIFLSLVERGKVFTPLIVARSFTLLTGLLLLKLNRLPLPALASNPLALLAGLLDASGNLLYVLARQFTRLDVAAVLSSLYPASTVLLSALLLKERVTPMQKAGVIVCLIAVMLIAR